MNRSILVITLSGTLGLLALSCAPIDEPPPSPAAALSGERTGTVVDKTKTGSSAGAAGTGAIESISTQPEPVKLSPGVQGRIEAAIRNVRQRELLTTNGFWTVFHGILGLGPNVPMTDPKTKERVGALEYISKGNLLRGLRFRPTPAGVDVITTADSIGQGHQDQFIAEMAQWGIKADHKFLINGSEYTFLDFVNHSQARARTSANQELSWTVVVVAQFKGTDAKWTNVFAENLTLEEVVRYELEASVESAPCGGTHRLFGLSWAYHLHLQNGGKTEGIWQAVAEKTARYARLARMYRNADGTFSTNSFRGPGNAADKNLRINTTGHILEWLALALNDTDIREPWVQEAANALAMTILDQGNAPIDGGSMYHAVHGLLMYYARIYGRGTICPPELYVPLPPGWKPV